MARYDCADCNKSLRGYPKIKVEGEIYCYSCAKRLVATLDSSTEIKHAKEVETYDSQFEKWRSWDKKREVALPSIKAQTYVTLGAAIACAFIMSNPIFIILPGLIVGFMANQLYFMSKNKNWLRRNPEPYFPSSPSNNFIRDKIELVGGVSGTSLSSGYRRKILERDSYQCQICCKVFSSNELEVHHIKPQAKGGGHYLANLITLCWRCQREEIWFGHDHKMR